MAQNKNNGRHQEKQLFTQEKMTTFSASGRPRPPALYLCLPEMLTPASMQCLCPTTEIAIIRALFLSFTGRIHDQSPDQPPSWQVVAA
ncbi:MAG: hypothetical protein ACOY41_02305 [Pseudomonadota bacterium]